jgi:hypothetical protein
MKFLRSLLLATSYAGLLSFGALEAKADTLTLDSNSSTVLYEGYTGSGTICPTCTAGTQTFDLNTDGVWAGPIGASSWISFNPFTDPNGFYTAPNGQYTYFDYFTAAAGDTGSITVLADDTTSVYLNGIQITPIAPITTMGDCTFGTPNCTQQAMYALPSVDFVNGQNLLSFGVEQLYGGGTGLDFEATVNTATPEPSSVFMLGAGLLSAAGMVRRRIKA